MSRTDICPTCDRPLAIRYGKSIKLWEYFDHLRFDFIIHEFANWKPSIGFLKYYFVDDVDYDLDFSWLWFSMGLTIRFEGV